MKRQAIFQSLRIFILSLVCILSVSVLTSCESNDEPDMTIRYRVSIESSTPTSNTPDLEANMANSIIGCMQEAIHEAYPVENITGDDINVLSACDEAYNSFRTAYPTGNQSTKCVVKLYRSRMDNGIVRHSIILKTYRL